MECDTVQDDRVKRRAERRREEGGGRRDACLGLLDCRYLVVVFPGPQGGRLGHPAYLGASGRVEDEVGGDKRIFFVDCYVYSSADRVATSSSFPAFLFPKCRAHSVYSWTKAEYISLE